MEFKMNFQSYTEFDPHPVLLDESFPNAEFFMKEENWAAIFDRMSDSAKYSSRNKLHSFISRSFCSFFVWRFLIAVAASGGEGHN